MDRNFRRWCSGLPIRRRCLRALKCSCLLMLVSLPLSLLQAQTDFTRIYGPVDRDVSVPSATGLFGHVDPAASTEILEHIAAVGASPWQDMSASGKITYPLGDTSEADSATLTIFNGDRFRLDVQTPQGTRSTRIVGGSGATLRSDGSKDFLLPFTAAQGLVAFPQLRVATFPTSQTSLYDKGLQSVDGTTLHRLAVEHPLGKPPSALPSAKATVPPSVVTDLYFDPASHLLMKSVASIKLSGMGSDFIRCTTYEDYRKVGAVLVPFRISESLNGQVQWTLQLDSVALNTGLAQTNFIF
jgi:hypothetical protein